MPSLGLRSSVALTILAGASIILQLMVRVPRHLSHHVVPGGPVPPMMLLLPLIMCAGFFAVSSRQLGPALACLAAVSATAAVEFGRPELGLLALLAIAALAAAPGLWLEAPPAVRSIIPPRSLYARHASTGLHPFVFMRDKAHYLSQNGQAFLAYGKRAGAAIVLGTGIGAADQLGTLYAQFRADCQRRGWRVGFYQVSAPTADAIGTPHRFRVGDEAIVHLPSFGLDGPRMARLRHEVSRARRHQVSVTIKEARDMDPRLWRTLDRLMRRRRHWLLGPMAFSVGRPTDRPNVDMKVGLAYSSKGRIVAYTTWLLVPAARGVALDEMGRSHEMPPGTMDLLVYSCLQQLAGQVDWASLGLAPALGPASGSLFTFKAKYHPQWEHRYLTVARLRDWPRVAIATVLLHYPELAQPWQRISIPQVHQLS